VALIHATYSVDQLVVQGQRALFATVRATQNSQVLVESITDMERNARQYKVLGDIALLEVYQENHQIFLDTVNRLTELNLPEQQRQRLDRVIELEDGINDALISFPPDAPETAVAVGEFEGLAHDARNMLADNRKLVAGEVAQLEANGGEVQRSLVAQAMALVPGALILTARNRTAWAASECRRAHRDFTVAIQETGGE